jgi:hypothetical protein
MLGATLGANEYLKRVCDEVRRFGPAQLESFSALIEDAHEAGRSAFIQGTITVGITGFDGRKLRATAQHGLHADVADMGIAASLHQVVFRRLIDDHDRRISGPIVPLVR